MDAFDFHHQRHVVFLVLSREERIANIELVQDTPETPHVDRSVVGNTQHNLGCSIKPRLDVCVDFLVFKATTSEIDNLDT